MEEINFRDWLQIQLNIKDWNQSDLAIRSGLSTAHVSNLINGLRNPGKVSCRTIATALDVPPEAVLRAAGLMPNLPNQKRVAEETLSYKASQLTEMQLDELIGYIDFIQDRDNGRKPKRRPKYETIRESSTSPEVVKGE
jgi:transcriptional regulator with XRE-family HTH domain